jgi:hypothetical protein
MFFAKRKDTKERVSSLSNSVAKLKDLTRQDIIICPVCEDALRLRVPSRKRTHFYHRHACSYEYYERESEEHESGKDALARRLHELYPNAAVEMEHYIPETRQISDVLVIQTDGNRWAFEMQCSKIRASVWRERHQLYQKAGIVDFWILGESIKHGAYIFNLSELEKVLYDIDKLCYLNHNHGRLTLKTFYAECTGPLSSATIKDNHWHLDESQQTMNSFKIPDTEDGLHSQPVIHSYLDIDSLPGIRYYYSDKEILKYFRTIESTINILTDNLFEEATKYLNIEAKELPSLFNKENDDNVIFMCDNRVWRTYIFYVLCKHYSGKKVLVKDLIEWLLKGDVIPINQAIQPDALREVMLKLILSYLLDLYFSCFVGDLSRESFLFIDRDKAEISVKQVNAHNDQIKSYDKRGNQLMPEWLHCNACRKPKHRDSITIYKQGVGLCRGCANKYGKIDSDW